MCNHYFFFNNILRIIGLDKNVRLTLSDLSQIDCMPSNYSYIYLISTHFVLNSMKISNLFSESLSFVDLAEFCVEIIADS